jgi:hypothetical protein
MVVHRSFGIMYFLYFQGRRVSQESSTLIVAGYWFDFDPEYRQYDRLCGLVSEFLAIDPEVRVRFLALPGVFLRSSGTGTGSTQPRDDN